MPNSDHKTNVLEERFTHSILISLFYNNNQKKTSLLNEISKSSSIIGRVEDLEKEGLVKVTIDRFNNNTKWVSLTEKGRDVAALLIDIRKILLR